MMFIAHRLLRDASVNLRLAFLFSASITSLFLASCAEMPSGPSVAVMPGPNKPFDVFMEEDQLCRGWAAHSIGLAGHDAAAERLLASTITGAAIGALAGAAVGGHRNVGAGAAMGTVVGVTAGANQSAVTAGSAQRRYDIAYQQCMYSKGNFVPTYGYGVSRYPAPSLATPPPPPMPR
ncbi:hypothetical protein [Rhodoferax sp. UBA5149]|uniref:hypothetical protein n=1 Tax=Rhodoferax sp. UBA5149 TaxID=1947379 RepID=UPI0025F04D6E|nr:hypothetical protein [Rhodoferax sp. UBA5149]